MTPDRADCPPVTSTRPGMHVRNHTCCMMPFRKIGQNAGASFGMCHKILTEDLQMRQLSTKLMPHLVTVHQKEIAYKFALTFVSETVVIQTYDNH